jgi:MarR family transcriptional regulator for hemolysin
MKKAAESLTLTEKPGFDEQPISEGLRISATLGLLVVETARLLRRRFIHHARQDDLPLSRMVALTLVRIAQNEGIKQTTLAGLLDIEPITLGRAVDRLEEAGLVERRPHPSDRRVKTLWLKPAAHPMLTRIEAVKLRVRTEAFVGFTPAVRDRFLDELYAVRRNLNAAGSSTDPLFEIED